MVIRFLLQHIKLTLITTYKKTALFNRIILASNFISALLYLQYPTEISYLMISNTKSTPLKFFQFLTFPFVSTSHSLFLITNLYFTIGQSALEKKLGTIGFAYYFILNNIVIGALFKSILVFFNESYLSLEQCEAFPCFIFGPCGFSTFYYFKVLIDKQDIEFGIFGILYMRCKFVPYFMLFVQFLVIFAVPGLFDYFLDSIVGLVLVYLRKIYLDNAGILSWTVAKENFVAKAEMSIKGLIDLKSYVLQPMSRIKKSMKILNGIEEIKL